MPTGPAPHLSASPVSLARTRSPLARVPARMVMLGVMVIVTVQFAASGATAAAVRPMPRSASTGLTTPGALTAVSETPAGDVWAIGWAPASGTTQPLVVHWSGSSWEQTAIPNLGKQPELLGVAGTSSMDAWIVGSTTVGTGTKTLILHWDGSGWSQVQSPAPGIDSSLSGVVAISADDAWAVGGAYNPSTGGDQALIFHWNGTSWNWTIAASPGRDSSLDAVTAVSADDVWAVGGYDGPSGGGRDTGKTLILHWNGLSWKRVTSLSPNLPGGGGRDILGGVAVTSMGRAWATGVSAGDCGCGSDPGFIESSGGHGWSRVRTSPPIANLSVSGVALASPDHSWVAGDVGLGRGPATSLMLSCDLSICARVATPSPGKSASLSGVTALSSDDAWAVGEWSTTPYSQPRTLILHWNGSTWS